MPDAIFSHPRAAAVYDALDWDRSDLGVYAEIVLGELGATSVLDIGCGTGTFALMLAGRGCDVVGLDPAGASLDVARSKPGAGAVLWIDGDISVLPRLQADVAVMTGNVAQVFTGDDEWADVVAGAFGALRPGGWLVFESRDPANRAWERWTRDLTFQRIDVPGVGAVQDWADVVAVDGELVTFESPTVFEADGERIESTSTLRFRSRADLTTSLERAGFDSISVRDAPDRPGAEFVFLARRPPT